MIIIIIITICKSLLGRDKNPLICQGRPDDNCGSFDSLFPCKFFKTAWLNPKYQTRTVVLNPDFQMQDDPSRSTNFE